MDTSRTPISTKRVVVKIGTSLITTSENQLDLQFLEHCIEEVKVLKKHDFSVVLVISGAVSLGQNLFRQFGFLETTKSLSAGVGQIWLISQIAEIFRKKRLLVAQFLLRPSDLQNPTTRSNVQQTLTQAIEKGVIAVLNENDTIELNGFGGNDHLASEIATLIEASHLVILTNVEGIYSNDMTVLHEFSIRDPIKLGEMKEHSLQIGVGGIEAKINAACNSAKNGIETVIANGRQKNILQQLLINQIPMGTKIIL